MLGVYARSFSSGYFAGKRRLVSLDKVRNSSVWALNRNLEYKVPGYGDLLRNYKDWERRKLFGYFFRSRAGLSAARTRPLLRIAFLSRDWKCVGSFPI